MTVHVDELTTEVAMERGQSPAPASRPSRSPGWTERENLRILGEQLDQARRRTDAAGFDD